MIPAEDESKNVRTIRGEGARSLTDSLEQMLSNAKATSRSRGRGAYDAVSMSPAAIGCVVRGRRGDIIALRQQ